MTALDLDGTRPRQLLLTLTALPELPKQTSPRAYTNDDQRRAFMELLAGRDGNHCFYCRTDFHQHLSKRQRRRIPVACRRIRTLDHLIPHQILPQGSPANYVLACSTCNSAKGNKVPTVLAVFLAVLVMQQIALNAKGVRL